jgi:branched-chain amino acid transport system permease protein
MDDFRFLFEVVIGGLLAGIMYSLVALGFVLIYKASGVFNFAQGAMVFFAVLSFVGFMELGLPFWAAASLTTMPPRSPSASRSRQGSPGSASFT